MFHHHQLPKRGGFSVSRFFQSCRFYFCFWAELGFSLFGEGILLNFEGYTVNDTNDMNDMNDIR